MNQDARLRPIHEEELFFADKPAGVTTHTSLAKDVDLALHPLSERDDGFVEYLSTRTGQEFFVSHRLDRGTTGAIVFAKNAEAAEALRLVFSEREAEKTYLFLTDQKPTEAKSSFEIRSFIERRGSSFVSEQDSPNSNATTSFRLLEESHGFFLWEARPESGKPHQIRLHAEHAGIPVLGDDEHSGSPFPALCLHSSEIHFKVGEKSFKHSSPAPRWYHSRELCLDHDLATWLTAIDRRERILRSLPDHDTRDLTLRWIHTDGLQLRADQYGEVIVLSWFGAPDAPSRFEEASIEQLCQTMGWNKRYLQVRGNRGRAPQSEAIRLGPTEPPEKWLARENGLLFELRRNSGLSPGLFLDQRLNRKWVLERSQGHRVLNLFCYTGGFSVAAAAGGASQVVSVDLSKAFLEWTKTNFAHNSLDTTPHEFRAIDARSYLDWASKKGLRFDLIVCDPPSFGRSDKGVFRLEDEFETLIRSCLKLLEPKGTLLFSCNFESWTEDDFEARAIEAVTNSRREFQIVSSARHDWDFELPRRKQDPPRVMKSFIAQRNS